MVSKNKSIPFINFQDDSGKTALMYLSALNSESGVRLLLDLGADFTLKDIENQQTALHIAGMAIFELFFGSNTSQSF